jgi:hypothetical protein
MALIMISSLSMLLFAAYVLVGLLLLAVLAKRRNSLFSFVGRKGSAILLVVTFWPILLGSMPFLVIGFIIWINIRPRFNSGTDVSVGIGREGPK